MAFQELNFLSLKTETKWIKSLLHFLWKETDSLVVLLKTQEFGHNTRLTSEFCVVLKDISVFKECKLTGASL